MVKGSTATVEAPSKIDAVRQCVEAGITKPKEGVAWIKSNLGVDVNANSFSAYKAQIAKDAAPKHGRRTRTGATNGHTASATVAANGNAPKAWGEPGQISVKDSAVLSGLLGQYGPATIHGMVEVLSGVRQPA